MNFYTIFLLSQNVLIGSPLETLQQQREIIVVEAKARKKSKSRTTIFFNEQEHDLVAAPELKERLRDMWTDISMPQTEFTLIEALNSRGITYVFWVTLQSQIY